MDADPQRDPGGSIRPVPGGREQCAGCLDRPPGVLATSKTGHEYPGSLVADNLIDQGIGIASTWLAVR